MRRWILPLILAAAAGGTSDVLNTADVEKVAGISCVRLAGRAVASRL